MANAARNRKLWISLLILVCCSTTRVRSLSRDGYLINLEVRNGVTRLLSASEIDNYVESRHLDAEDDWSLLLLNEVGENIGARRIRNPYSFSLIVPTNQGIPLMVKIPSLDGLAAMAIYDQYRREQALVPIDSSFKSMAAANRQRFLERDRENRRLLQQRARVPQPRVSMASMRRGTAPRFEELPIDQQNRIQEQISFEMERSHPVRPEEARRQLSAEHRSVHASSVSTSYLSGRITDLDTGAPVSGIKLVLYMYTASYSYFGTTYVTSNVSGDYSVSVSGSYVSYTVDLNSALSKRYARTSGSCALSGDTNWNIKLIGGVQVSGSILDAQNRGVAGTIVTTSSVSQQITYTGTTGSYVEMVPMNRMLTLSVSVPAPYVSPSPQSGFFFSADTILNFNVESGWVVSGHVTAEEGSALPGASIMIRQVNATPESPYWTAATNSTGKYSVAVPKDLVPNSFVISAYAANYLQQIAGLTVSGDTSQDFQLVKGNMVTGTVRDSSGKTLEAVRVRAYREGTFINSTTTGPDGTYSLTLPPGTYDFEVFPPVASNLPYYTDPLPIPLSNMGPAKASNVAVNSPIVQDFVLPLAPGILTVNLYFLDQADYQLFSDRVLNRFELTDGEATVYANSAVPDDGGFDTARGKYFRRCVLYPNPGRYTFTAFLTGCKPIVSTVDVSSQTTISVDFPAPFLWTGVLRGHDGTPLANMSIVSYNDMAKYGEWTTTDSSGRFSILLTPNGFVKFYTDKSSRNIMHTERIGDISASRNADCVLEELKTLPDNGSTLVQLYGVPDRSKRWNIVILGDGYTDVHETFQDLNGNGRWDGVVYYDLNKNGVWDTGEPYQQYGNALPPVAGKDPTTGNEPFTDLNGDGILSLHDQEIFDQDTLDVIRNLFGQDEWCRYRDAFNVFRIRVISRQAGHDVRDDDGNVIVSRDTALGGAISSPTMRWGIGADPMLVSQLVNQYVPEADTTVTLVNQPIPIGRDNSAITLGAGEARDLCNYYAVAHEMAHNIAHVADEYREYPTNFYGPDYTLYTTLSPNISTAEDREQVPWKHLISSGREIPSVAGSGGIGVYEGGWEYTGGYYRPTEHCMMVRGDRYCPVCTAQIRLRMSEIMGTVPDAVPHSPSQDSSGLYPRFQWDALEGASHFQFELEKSDGTLIASYDVYDTSFTLPFALTAGTDYKWRIRAGSASSWGNWSSWVTFKPQAQTITQVFAQVAAGGSYRTTLVGMNPGSVAANVLAGVFKSDGTRFDSLSGDVNWSIQPMGIARIDLTGSGDTAAGYARLAADSQIDGTALFRTMDGNIVTGEAAVGLSKPGKSFIIYVDYQDGASSGYAVANYGPDAANITAKLRDKSGSVKDTNSFSLAAGHHFPEFAHQRFPGIVAGFEGSVEFTSDQNLAATALRFEEGGVFSTIPVVVDQPGSALYFPQLADGGGYRSSFILVNPSSSAVSAILEFFADDGSPLALSIGGASKTSQTLDLAANGVAHLATDGTSSGLKVGWARASAPAPIAGSLVFQVRSDGRIQAEAAVAASPLGQHLMSYIDSIGSTQSGVAICNPNAFQMTLALNLRNSSGEITDSANVAFPAKAHMAGFVRQWFPGWSGDFEGTLEVLAPAPVSAVALRYDNPQLNVFATLPVVVIK